MSERGQSSWEDLNRGVLLAEFDRLRRRLRARDTVDGRPAEGNGEHKAPETTGNSALAALVRMFGLSPFERDVLLLCAGVELDSDIAERCAKLAGRSTRGSITFSLALAFLEGAHWSALSAGAPLRRYRLLAMEEDAGIATAPLHIEERVLDYMMGMGSLDARLERYLTLRPMADWMAEEHYRLATEVLGGIREGRVPESVLHLWGDDAAGREGVAALVAQRAGHRLFVLRHEDMPQPGAQTEEFLQLWARECRLLPAFLLLAWERDETSPQVKHVAERAAGGVVLTSREPVRLHRPMEAHEVNKPGALEQVRLWKEALGEWGNALAPQLNEVAAQFRMGAEQIGHVAESALKAMEADVAEADEEWVGKRIWNMCRMVARPRLEGLAQRIVPAARWDDLVLPEAQKETLRQLCSQARHRLLVNETWGFAARGRRGLGLSALFAGPSGTGKTMAAEVLANELKLDLFRVDLSAVVSKYIGETEKNLQRVFDGAEDGGAILLFDEADALFGKRAEVKDSHDRYANIEVGYLLQRMESFSGIAVLTTNVKSSLDKAFQRRLRFSVEFPFPDQTQREAIWAKVFPEKAPTEGLQTKRLATLNMSGGNIRNIAVNAAFLAAHAQEPVGMQHILTAAHQEALKVERPLAEMEVRGWV